MAPGEVQLPDLREVQYRRALVPRSRHVGTECPS